MDEAFHFIPEYCGDLDDEQHIAWVSSSSLGNKFHLNKDLDTRYLVIVTVNVENSVCTISVKNAEVSHLRSISPRSKLARVEVFQLAQSCLQINNC